MFPPENLVKASRRGVNPRLEGPPPTLTLIRC